MAEGRPDTGSRCLALALGFLRQRQVVVGCGRVGAAVQSPPKVGNGIAVALGAKMKLAESEGSTRQV